MLLTSWTANGVLSSLGRCSSKASTIQLAMMVRRTMYSKGVREVKDKKCHRKFTINSQQQLII